MSDDHGFVHRSQLSGWGRSSGFTYVQAKMMSRNGGGGGLSRRTPDTSVLWEIVEIVFPQ